MAKVYELHGIRIFECAAEGPRPVDDRAAAEFVGAAWAQSARMVVIPAERLGDEFFRLKTRIAGEFIQKFVTYRMRLAIVGDISRHLSGSPALRDFVYESNLGAHVWFAADPAKLDRLIERHTGQP